MARQTETRIADLLTAELVVSALEAGGRDDVMNALATRVAACHPQVDASRLVEALRERERQMSTALVDGVAIPHARLDGLTAWWPCSGEARAASLRIARR